MSVADVVEYRWTVSAAVAESAGRLGPRLDDFLADRVPLVSRMHLRASVRSGAVLVDGRQAPPGLRLHVGAQVDARLDVGRATAMTPQQIPLEILHDDERFAVVVKPAGMLVHPTRGVKSGTLANALSGLWNQGEGPAVRPIFVHRLDKQTSGLMLVAKQRAAAARLSRAFASGQVKKRYLAWLEGELDEDTRTIEAPVARLGEQRPQWGVSADGKPGLTRLHVRERRAGRTLVELEPVTGRTNQLRIHCAWIGRPIVGDEAYGAQPAPRLFLHAFRIEFPDPDLSRSHEFSQIPDAIDWPIEPSM
ncbi:MAG: RluA family pseudouridine synthase [Bryobacterales bacterium]|nr:RluA family pseudouridine synthase [Bryobacterales bacterium]